MSSREFLTRFIVHTCVEIKIKETLNFKVSPPFIVICHYPNAFRVTEGKITMKRQEQSLYLN